MKKLFIAILVCFSSFSANAAGPVNPGIIPSVTIANRSFVNPDNLIWLLGECSSGAVKLTLRKTNSASGYTPSGTKTFIYKAITVYQKVAATAGDYFYLGYSDNDVGNGTSTAFTNFVGFGAAAASSNFVFPILAGVATSKEYIIGNSVVPNGKFTGINCGLASGTIDFIAVGEEK